MVAVAAALGVTGTASAESTPATDFDLRFTSSTPGTHTGARLRILYKDPSDPDGKPSPLRTLRLEAPPGTRFDGNAMPACRASDADLRAQGRAACPPASRMGAGTLTVMTGFAALDPYATDATLFNSGDGILELITERSTGATLGIDRTTFEGPSRLDAHPPRTPGGPPEGETSVREILFTYNRTPVITTPSRCPADRRWTSRVVYSTADGSTYSARSSTPCVPRRQASRPRLRLRVAPRRVRAGARRRFRVRVSSSRRACVRRATIRFAGRRFRTSVRGRARLRVRLRRPGTYRVTARKRGCRGAKARVLARR